MDRRDSCVAQGKGERGARAAMDGSRHCWGSGGRLPWIGKILASCKERGSGARGQPWMEARRCWGSRARLPWIGEILASRKERGSGARGQPWMEARRCWGSGAQLPWIGDILASRKERGSGARGQPWMEVDAAGGARRGCHGSARFSRRARKGGAGRAGSHGWKSTLLGERGAAAMDRRDSRVAQGKGSGMRFRQNRAPSASVDAYIRHLSSSRDYNKKNLISQTFYIGKWIA
jgi:hypothetical protein